MSNVLTKFQDLLRELFQFDCADLDFGIYRIMNHKRDVIEDFILRVLPKVVNDELGRAALAEASQAARELQEVADQIRTTLGPDALDAEGNLVKFQDSDIGKKYLNLKSKTADARNRDAIEAAIYNHLYAFFSRYYQDGDFISKRRYSKRERYAIPYNGEEVYLYWANYDQYYVKTAEHFTDYAFTAPNGVAVHFKLQAANVEQNNVKGAKRFFMPLFAEIAWDEEASCLVVPFEFRPLTEQETITFGQRNQQESIFTKAIADIPKRLSPKTASRALAALTAERHKTTDGKSVSFLEHHLRQYTRRNTSDFFIHKNLRDFLSRELDFYLKNEVLMLDEIEVAGEERAESWFQMMRLIKSVGSQIIEFLHQMEEFQKMLWEKKKFITEANYCITVGNIAEDFYADIASCEDQWDEWRELFHIDELKADLFNSGKSKKEKRKAFLRTRPTLVLDTKHFDRNFVDRLVGSFDDLDDIIDGLLLQSENFQAIRLLQYKCSENVKCIYLDPPYNTAASEILYKNNYKHSSWLSLIVDRLASTRKMLSPGGILSVAIDDAEYHRLYHCLASIFGEESILGTVVVRSNPAGRSALTGFSVSHDYTLFVGSVPDTTVGELPKTDEQISRYDQIDNSGRFEWVNFRKHGGLNANRTARPKLFYPIYATDDGQLRIPKLTWDKKNSNWAPLEHPGDKESVIYPLNHKHEEKTWKWGHETAAHNIAELTARPDRTGSIAVYMKSRMREGTLPSTLWIDKRFSATDYGTNLLAHIMGISNAFPFPKSVYSVAECLRVCFLGDAQNCLDFFAGSGTTGHAVINLNREDGGRRKFILVEMADYFDTVLMPRIKKITFSPEWKEGRPKRIATPQEAERSPRIVKYIRLESYEDALNNIAFDDASGQQAMRFDDYLLQYMLKWETRGSETLLNIEKLARPFSYKLNIHLDGRTHEKLVDIPETFNYLFGLNVSTRRTYDDGGRRYLVYRGRIDHRHVTVIWRKTEGWKKADYERDKKFVTDNKLAENADEIFVNGDSLIPGARALDPLFKARMFAPMEP